MHKPKALGDKENKCIVYFRGGGCVFGTAEHREEVCNKMAAFSECIVINCNYRKCPESKFPLPVFDAYAILKHVLASDSDLGIDKTKIAMVGESGGSCIILGVAQHLVQMDEADIVKMLVLPWPMCGDSLVGGPQSDWTPYELSFKNMDMFYEMMGGKDSSDDPYIYPIKMSDEVMKKIPQTVVLTSEFDCYKRDAIRLAQRLNSHGRLLEFCIHPGLNHGSPILFPSDSEQQRAFWTDLAICLKELF